MCLSAMLFNWAVFTLSSVLSYTTRPNLFTFPSLSMQVSDLLTLQKKKKKKNQ